MHEPQNSPLPATAFLGREAELKELAELLANPNVRLLTICGPGGAGKTRLALEAAARNSARFADGAVFVPLQLADSVAVAVTAIADALAIPLTGAGDPYEQVLGALRDKQLLLVLDNAEQLGEAVVLFSRLLAAAPGLTLLVTSREALKLQEEWHYPLEGLTLADNAGEGGDALRLFVERARQVRPDLVLEPELAAAHAICRLVEGMPLALELAAAWTRTLSCAAIAAEIERGLDLLTSSMRNIPARHRSLRAVCDQSWALLRPEEQRAFCRLAIFRAGFSAEAAAAVAGAALPLLDALIGKSLVRLAPEGRYHIHALLRQYGEERLAEHGAALAETTAAAGRFYATFLSSWFARCAVGGVTPEALVVIAPELENIGSHWGDILAASDGEELRGIALLIQNIYFARGPYPQGVALITAALEQLRARPATPERRVAEADGLNSLGWFQVRQGQIGAARRSFTASAAIYAESGQPRPVGDCTDPLMGLGVVALIGGEYREAVRLGMAVFQQGEAEGHRGNQLNGLYVLTGAALAQGQYAVAERYARRMDALAEELGNRWFRAYCQIELGHIASGLGAYGEAQAHYAAAYRLRETFADPQGMAVALAEQGGAALLAGAPAEAARRYERSLAIYRYLGDQGGHAAALDGLGRAHLALGARASARAALAQALRITVVINFIPLQLRVLVSIAELLIAAGDRVQGFALVQLVARHPAADSVATRRAQALLLSAGATLTPLALDGGAEDLERLVSGALDALDTLSVTDTPPPAAGEAGAAAGLVEPLTEREREILYQIAAGRSNQEIAGQLIFSIGTVKWYTSQIYGKLGVKSRTQAIARARELGLIA
jgi:predicted ATPase/DNA-binding CsgD family transcriptional regulator